MLFLSFFHVACMATLTMQLVVWFCTLREDFGYTVLTLVHIFCCYFLIFLSIDPGYAVCTLVLHFKGGIWLYSFYFDFGYTGCTLTVSLAYFYMTVILFHCSWRSW